MAQLAMAGWVAKRTHEKMNQRVATTSGTAVDITSTGKDIFFQGMIDYKYGQQQCQPTSQGKSMCEDKQKQGKFKMHFSWRTKWRKMEHCQIYSDGTVWQGEYRANDESLKDLLVSFVFFSFISSSWIGLDLVGWPWARSLSSSLRISQTRCAIDI